ncbi:MAG: VCBS repeat-containing protein [Deltaproteobacteria bacterium]|nr:VCBS repeat-containing protein [Deltaproteobacteria bacterium]
MNEQSVIMFVARCGLLAAVTFVFFLPMWWAVGRLKDTAPFLRVLAAIGGALVAWLGVVNLIGRITQNSIIAMGAWFAFNLATCVWLIAARREELSARALFVQWRTWAPLIPIAMAIGVPQWLFAVSTPYWDEVASSAIHLTAPSQFAEGLFPPRHNAFPDVPIKYHYAVTMLAGALTWTLRLSPNVSVDVVTVALHLFVFLFLFFWLAQIGFRWLACFWGSFSVLLGGSLAWLYVPWVETYSGYPRQGSPAQLVHHYDASRGYFANLLEAGRTAVFHLRNLDGSNSNLPWDIANQLQQHAVALGVAVAIFAAWLLGTWMRSERRSLLAACAFTFGLLFLCHAVFGAVSAVTAGLLLAGRWVSRPTLRGFTDAALFTVLVAFFAFAHGGVLSRGDFYGLDLTTLSVRPGFGYSEGGVLGFINWNVAGFGLPLVLAVVAMVAWRRSRRLSAEPRRFVFHYFLVMLIVSYLPAQFLYYSYGARAIEEYTEIAKFFFVSHLALAILSAFALALSVRLWRWWIVAPALLAMAIVPCIHVYAAAFSKENEWLGFYESPFPLPAYADVVEIGQKLAGLKQSNRDVYFDVAWDSESRRGFLDELQIHSGSIFSVTPRRYERTGSFLIDATLVAEQVRKSGRMARLRPGAEADSGALWYYESSNDLERMPLIVRSRFAKLVAEKIFLPTIRAGDRNIYRIAGTTRDVDAGIERYWRPRVVLQGEPSSPISFYDRAHQEVLTGDRRQALPRDFVDDYALVLCGHFGQAQGFTVARMADSYFSRGVKMSDLTEYSAWYWSTAGVDGVWSKERRRWTWDLEVPLVVDVEGKGTQEVIAWRRASGEWLRDNGNLKGPATPSGLSTVPVVGHFAAGAQTLGAYDTATGNWTLSQIGAEAKPLVTIQFGAPGDILVPGDYDGDGLDELVVWRPKDQSWYRRDPKSGAVERWTFGTGAGVPLPHDYDGDRRLDLAYWDAEARKIYVSFNHGKSVDRALEVPPDALPAFVNLY